MALAYGHPQAHWYISLKSLLIQVLWDVRLCNCANRTSATYTTRLQHPGRLEPSETPLWEPQVSQIGMYLPSTIICNTERLGRHFKSPTFSALPFDTGIKCLVWSAADKNLYRGWIKADIIIHCLMFRASHSAMQTDNAWRQSRKKVKVTKQVTISNK